MVALRPAYLTQSTLDKIVIMAASSYCICSYVPQKNSSVNGLGVSIKIDLRSCAECRSGVWPEMKRVQWDAMSSSIMRDIE